MEFKTDVLWTIKQALLLCLIIVRDVQITSAKSMAVDEDAGGNIQVTADEELQRVDFKVHILTKRDTDQEQSGKRHIVRTFPASDPLDPKAPIQKSPAEIFGDFETVDEIFQPTIVNETESEENVDELKEGEETKETKGESDEKETDNDGKGAQALSGQYSAQYPYSEVSRTSEQSQGAGYDRNPGGYDQTYVQRRVVLTGRRGEPTTETQYTRTEHSSSGIPQTHETQYVGQTGSQYPAGSSSYSTYNRQYPHGTQHSTGRYYSRGNTGTGYSGYQTAGSSSRGAYYDGPLYVDNNGHYIDAYGRHLDSTGRYYDTSGRYQDAIVTRTVTYETGPSSAQSYVDSSGQRYGYVDQTGSNGGQYSGSSSQTGSSYGGSYDDQYGRSQIGGTPVNSYGGTQLYSGGQGYPATYDPIVSRISSDPTCSSRSNMRVTINGLPCASAVAQVGAFVCYNYERVSTECCESCLQVKRAENVGCEYGDRSNQCRNIQPHDCYNERNRQICCQRCAVFRQQRTHLESSCGYGDMTPRCQEILQRPHLCYLPDNQRYCCETCPRLANEEEPDCRWGNQNPELCVPFDSTNRLRLNCYAPALRNVCCATCRSLRERIREPIQGCEYGDQPVQISTNQGVLGCGEYIRLYGEENCNGGEIAQKCCYTCFRYRQRRG